MFINWKIRLKNEHFWFQLGLSFIMPILSYKGITGADINTWPMLFELIIDALSNPFVFVTIMVSIYNALIDNTTPGISDSTRVMSYDSVKDSRQNNSEG